MCIRDRAYVIPTSQNVVRGGTYSARVILAAVDSTQRPSIYIAGEKQPDNAEGWFETVCNRTGEFFLDGYLELAQGNGEVLRREFSQKYTVAVSYTHLDVYKRQVQGLSYEGEGHGRCVYGTFGETVGRTFRRVGI